MRENIRKGKEERMLVEKRILEENWQKKELEEMLEYEKEAERIKQLKLVDKRIQEQKKEKKVLKEQRIFEKKNQVEKFGLELWPKLYDSEKEDIVGVYAAGSIEQYR